MTVAVEPIAKKGWRKRTSSLVAGLFGLALLIGIPIVLLTYVGNPIDRLPESIEELQQNLEFNRLPVDWIVGVLAIFLWFLWVQYVWALLWEIAVVGPAAAKGRLVRSAPFAPGFVRSLAATVASGLLAASVAAGSGSLATVASQLATSSEALATGADAAQMVDIDANGDINAGSGANRVHVVGARESLWSISGGDEQMVSRLLELNEHQLRSPLDLRPGMQLVVPPSLDLGSVPEAPGAPSNPGTPEYEGEFLDDNHIVVEGDNIWEIAEDRLEVIDGAPPSNQEIAGQVNEVVDLNPDVIEDPDLIYPGEVLRLPDSLVPEVSVAPSYPAPAPDRAPGSGFDDPADGGSGQDDGAVDMDSTGPGGSGGGSEEKADDGMAVAPGDPPSDPGAGPTAPGGGGSGQAESRGDGSSPSTTAPPNEPGSLDDAFRDSPVRVAGLLGASVVLASALVGTVVAWKRRLRAIGGAAAVRREIDDDGRSFLRELASGADREFVRWAGEQLRSLRRSAATTSDGVPEVVYLARDGAGANRESGITVQWDRPMSDPITGWERLDDHRWHRAYDDLEETEDDAGPAAIPGLISLGRLTAGPGASQLLLLDLESVGSLAVGGDNQVIEAATRSIILEAGAGHELSNVRVTTVGFELDGPNRLERVRSLTEQDALTQAEAQIDARLGSGQRGFRSAAEPDEDERIDLYVIRTIEASTDQWLDLAQPRSGIAVLLVGDMRSTRLGARLAITDDGVGTLDPHGESLHISGVLPGAARRLADLFEEVLDDPTADTGPVRSPREVLAKWSEDGGPRRPGQTVMPPGAPVAQADTGAAGEDADGPMVVKVLGPVRTPDRPELVAQPLSLVAYLAMQPDRSASRELAAKALLGDGASPDELDPVIDAARAQVGEDRLPPPTSGDQLCLYGFSTDLERLRELIMTSSTASPEEAADSLLDAMDLIEGPPFEGVTSDWAEADGLVDHVSELIEATTIRAVEALRAVGDVDLVPDVAQKGLKALPGNEPIYRTYLALAAEAGGMDLLEATYNHLERSLSLMSPATAERGPSEQTQQLRRRLIAGLESDPVTVESATDDACSDELAAAVTQPRRSVAAQAVITGQPPMPNRPPKPALSGQPPMPPLRGQPPMPPRPPVAAGQGESDIDASR